ncbi:MULTISPECIES: beta-N-acetylhexosaminidase [Aeromonas]|uniref:beta-N-acetylhexosaminidase n=1 Tax=Aeromonas TaxID=642 RepID=UPI001CCF45F9|nr:MULTISPECIES: beta-N-acetylhexosaminidase [Aeromonas]MCS3459556.1 hexosaminidase [Aeromonas sp. BIGb0445]UBO75153.1 family 20 glycosylhydrolase [Aeromonas rivuli]
MSTPLITIAIERRDEEDVWVLLTLDRLPSEPWQLHFCLGRQVDASSLKGGELIHQSGTYKVIAPHPGSRELALCCRKTVFKHLTDMPQGFFLSLPESQHGPQIIPVTVASQELGLDSPASVQPELASVDSEHGIVPQPRRLVRLEESYFRLAERAHVRGPGNLSALLGHFNELTSLALEQDHDAEITLIEAGLADEAYRLHITPQGVEIAAAGLPGWRHGLVSLAQWYLQHGESLPCIEIEDEPRFGLRVIHLDCGRHFQPMASLKRLLKQMSLYKFNRFHWHLTDDEGWRLEIKAFPALTEVGAWRGHGLAIGPQLSGGAARYGGFYSQDEARELIAYAASLGIEVIPEIDIPGHCHAAIKALPELLIEPADHSRYLSVQFFDDNVLNPALPGTYQFLDKVMDEVCELFPSKLVHMGGDEVPHGVWTDSPACQALMQQQGYRDIRELQGHLLRHCQDYLAAKGRQMVGWEEVLQGDKVGKEAIICAWTSFQAGLDAASQGYPVLMAAAQYLYLDLACNDNIDEPGLYWAGTPNLEQVYSCDPAPADFHANDNILGVLSPLWSELVHTRDRLDYMLFPRMLATAEVAWSLPSDKDWAHFCARLPGQLAILDQQQVRYRTPQR